MCIVHFLWMFTKDGYCSPSNSFEVESCLNSLKHWYKRQYKKDIKFNIAHIMWDYTYYCICECKKYMNINIHIWIYHKLGKHVALIFTTRERREIVELLRSFQRLSILSRDYIDTWRDIAISVNKIYTLRIFVRRIFVFANRDICKIELLFIDCKTISPW